MHRHTHPTHPMCHPLTHMYRMNTYITHIYIVHAVIILTEDMRKVKRLLALITLTVITLSSYKLLLTVHNVPTTNTQDTNVHHQERINSLNLNYARDHSTRKRTLRQLLQDNEITQLPVRVTTDCENSPPQSPRLKSLQLVTTNKNVHDIICLNETRLYEESFVQHGVPFDQLSVLDQKASIVRTVLNDLEHKYMLDDLEPKNNLVMETKVDMFAKEHELKLYKEESAQYISEQEKSKNKTSNVKVERNDKLLSFASKVSDGRVVLSHGAKTVRKPKPKGSRSRVLPSSKFTPSAVKQKKRKISTSMNPDLKKLKGVRVKQNLSLTARGFSSEWGGNSTLVRDRYSLCVIFCLLRVHVMLYLKLVIELTWHNLHVPNVLSPT